MSAPAAAKRQPRLDRYLNRDDFNVSNFHSFREYRPDATISGIQFKKSCKKSTIAWTIPSRNRRPFSAAANSGSPRTPVSYSSSKSLAISTGLKVCASMTR
jgi:hypothetical protein